MTPTLLPVRPGLHSTDVGFCEFVIVIVIVSDGCVVQELLERLEQLDFGCVREFIVV